MNGFAASNMVIMSTIIVLYVASTTWLSIHFRSRTNDQFMTAARAMSPLVIGLLIMSEFIGSTTTVGISQAAFTSGIAAGWPIIGMLIGFLAFGFFFVRKIYATGEYTISGAIRQKFGRGPMIIVSLILIGAFFVLQVANYISGAAVLIMVLNITQPQAMVLLAICCTFFFTLGGLKGFAYVNILHSAMKLTAIALVFGAAMLMTGGISPMVETLPPHYFTATGTLGAGTVVAWIFANVGAIFSTQPIIQAISANRNADGAVRSTLYAAALCVPLAIALSLIGVASRYLFPQMNSIYALPIFLQHMPVLLAAIAATGIVASIFISVSSTGLASVSLIIRDFYEPYMKPTAERKLMMTRAVSVFVGIAPLVCVFLVPEIIRMAIFTRALRLSISIVALVGFYLPLFNSARAAAWGLVLSGVGTTLWYLADNPFGIDNTYVALVMPILVMGIERAVTRVFNAGESKRAV